MLVFYVKTPQNKDVCDHILIGLELINEINHSRF